MLTSHLIAYPDPTRPHSFDFNERQEDVCVFYGRDRGEADTQAKILTPEIINNSWCEYMYVFGQDDVWRYCELSHEQAPTKEDLISVESGLNHEYRQMGIKRPKDFYGFLCESDIAKIRMMQEVLGDYDEDLSYNDNLIKKVKSELEEFKTDKRKQSEQGIAPSLEAEQDNPLKSDTDDLTQRVAAFMEQHNITDLEEFLSSVVKKGNAQM